MTFQRGIFLRFVILSEAKDPYDEAFVTIQLLGFFAPRACPEPAEGALRMTV